MSGAATPTAPDAPELDDRDMEPRTPMKRLGSTRKLAAFNNIRMQLSEQTRVLEARAEATAGVAGELHDYCRRRADLEHEYARALDKLARAAAQRDKDHKHKREQWPLTGAYACWQGALEATRALARDHAALAELYGGPLASRLQRAADDVLRLHRKCRDIVAERHEEVCAALAAAAGAAKAHGAAAADWRAAALKLRHAHDQRARLAAADPPRHKKLKALDKELEKRRLRHGEARTRALRARADYVLSLEAANATLQRYYLDDIADIVLCMEVGFEAVVGRAVGAAGAAEGAAGAAAGAAGATLRAQAAALDAHLDRQRLLAAHAQAFALPRPLHHQGASPQAQDDEMRALAGEQAGAEDGPAPPEPELAARLRQLEASARQLRAEARENAKTLDAAEAELVRQMEGPESSWDVSGVFGAAGAGAGAVAALAAPPLDPEPRRDLEDYYLAKFRSYVSCAGRLARLESKARALRRLGGAGGAEGAGGAASPPPSPPRRAAARLRAGQFAAPLDHRLPRVLTSCVRVIAAYGLRHQGVFRVSGSQVEMQALRAAFERGEDPLEHVRDASDINSVCGLLKMYLRELRPPLLPPQLQERLLRIAALPDDADFARRLADTLAALPLPSVLVLRYLFAFLAHLAEHSEHTMMDAWNLAICLGPTLLAAWGEGGAQVTAQNLVNELVKRAILHHALVFPQHVAPYALYARPPEEGDEDAEGEEAGRPEGAEDEPDAADDLSLFDDDDDDHDDGETGDTGDAGDTSDDAQPAPPPRRTSLAAQAAASEAVDDGDSSVAVSALTQAPRRVRPLRQSMDYDVIGGGGGGGGGRLEATPDLVLDLPARAALAADHFAHNHDTMRKRTPPATEGAGGSPVPARNTARVAAKFADLTLTGGSLKPALAAKPALLRRPTPHPQHARDAPPAPHAPCVSASALPPDDPR